MIFLLVLLQDQHVMVLLLESDLVSQLLAKNKHGEHIYLRGSDRRSVIPYVHKKKELLFCSSLILPVSA
jgi:hypothetical protein